MASGIPHGTIANSGAPGLPGGAAGQPGPGPGPAGGWTAGRIVAVVIGSVLALVSLGLLGGGGTLLWASQAMRHDGYLTTATTTYATPGYALASERVSLGWGLLLTGLVGEVRLQVTATNPDAPVFVAIGPAEQVEAYLSGTSYTTVTGAGDMAGRTGALAPALPRQAGIWVAQTTGTGTQVLRWTAHSGDWMAVAMNPDGAAGLAVRADAGVSAPGLTRVAVEAVIGGIIAALLATGLITVPVRLAARAR